jgi:hypothetical protein
VASTSWATPRFGRPQAYAVDGSPIAVRAAAIDAQSGRDLLTANDAGEQGPSLSFLYNLGQGKFLPEQRMGLSGSQYIVQAVAAGDFNADGRDDVAVAADDISEFPVRATVLVFINHGSGFNAAVPYPLSGLFPQCLEAVDVSGDGALDLVVCLSHSEGGRGAGLVTVLGGERSGDTPSGAFEQIFSGDVGTAPAALASGDVDDDGRTDLLVADPAEQRILILYGTADPIRFEPPVELAPVTGPVAALVNALPGQPLRQVLVASLSGGRLLTYRQTAPRAFAAPVEQQVAVLPRAMALGEIDDDGVDDLLVLSALGAELWYGEADGTFHFGESLSNDNALDALALADLNDDGRLDLAASASPDDRVIVVLNGADACAGDCDGSGMVMVSELVRGVNIALGMATVGSCPAFDLDGSGGVAINELIAGVNDALSGCGGAASQDASGIPSPIGHGS